MFSSGHSGLIWDDTTQLKCLIDELRLCPTGTEQHKKGKNVQKIYCPERKWQYHNFFIAALNAK